MRYSIEDFSDSFLGIKVDDTEFEVPRKNK